LTQINPGECDGLSPEEIKVNKWMVRLKAEHVYLRSDTMIQEKFPDEIVKSQKDPYTHRFPRAEVSILYKNKWWWYWLFWQQPPSLTTT
jgi:hypothetical protein